MSASEMIAEIDRVLHVGEAEWRDVLDSILANRGLIDTGVCLATLARVVGDAIRRTQPTRPGDFYGPVHTTGQPGDPPALVDHIAQMRRVEQLIAAAANRDSDTLHALIGALLTPITESESLENALTAALHARSALESLAHIARETHATVCILACTRQEKSPTHGHHI